MRRCALGVGRLQPFHLGHANIINTMIAGYHDVIWGLGSSGRGRERHDPWTIEERIQMLRNVYGRRVKIVPLQDIGAEQGSNSWCDYVLDRLKELNMPAPTDYFTGSIADSRWYVGRFKDEGDPIEPSADQQVDGVTRRLHIIRRDQTPFPPATDLRTFLETRSEGWKSWVPGVNHELIESTFPEDFKVRAGT